MYVGDLKPEWLGRVRYFIWFLGLFNGNVRNSFYTAQNFWMMINLKWCGRNRSWQNLRFSTDIWSEQGTPRKKRTVKTVGIPAAIRTQHLPNTSQKVTAWAKLNHVSVQPFNTAVTTYRLIYCGTGNRFFFHPKCLNRVWGPPSLLLHVYRLTFPGIKRPGREVDHSPQPSAEVKNEWSYTSNPSICFHDVNGANSYLLLYLPLL
jgi:hypothetical protein